MERLLELLHSPRWPAAVSRSKIVSSDEQMRERATGLLRFLHPHPLDGKRVLDFGCGHGHVVNEAANRGASLAVGYDVYVDERWGPPRPDRWFTAAWEEVAAHSFQRVVMYDVLDHVESEAEMANALRRAGSVLTDDGLLLLRCHPWASRHGAHLYYTLNKAYAHLVFPDEVLAEHRPVPAVRLLHPLAAYRAAVEAAGLRVAREEVLRRAVDPFFWTEPLVAAAIKAHWRASPDPALASGRQFPKTPMEIEYVDFVLARQ